MKIAPSPLARTLPAFVAVAERPPVEKRTSGPVEPEAGEAPSRAAARPTSDSARAARARASADPGAQALARRLAADDAQRGAQRRPGGASTQGSGPAANPRHIEGLGSVIPANPRPAANSPYTRDDAFRGAAQQVRADLGNVSRLAGAGDYQAAANALRTARAREYNVNANSIDSSSGTPRTVTVPTQATGDAILRGTEGTGDAPGTVEVTQRQLDFLGRMQAANPSGQPLHNPPNEQELRGYFGSLRGNPTRALDEYQAYAGAFHTHIGRARGYQGDPWGPNAPDVVYSADPTRYQLNRPGQTDGPMFGSAAEAQRYADQHGVRDGSLSVIRTNAPDSWSDLTATGGNRRVATSGGHAGQNVQDCEGFAYMAQQLLGEAGFSARAGEGQLATVPAGQNPSSAHMMALLRDPSGAPVVVSNDHVFTSTNVPGAGPGDRERVQSLTYAAWRELHTGFMAPTMTAYAGGPSSIEAQRAMTAQDQSRVLRFGGNDPL